MADIQEKIEQANQKVVDIIRKGKPVYIGYKPAIDVIPGMTKNTILYAGPPTEFQKLSVPIQQGVIAGLLFEGLASDFNGAKKLVESGKVVLAPCHEYGSVGGMTGITTASMPVHIVRNETFNTTAYAVAHSGFWRNAIQWGNYDADTINQLKWIANTLGPVVDAGLSESGGLDMKSLIARAIQMGDECHTRSVAATGLIISQLAPHVPKAKLGSEKVSEAFAWLRDSDTFALHVVMATAKSILEPAKGVDYSTIVTTMSRNGIEFGIKISSLGDKWFKGPAGKIETVFFSPDMKDEDALPDIGDSSIIETIGLGGMIHAAAPAQELLYGGTFDDALSKTHASYSIATSEHDTWRIPSLDLRGTPLGIDIRKVLKTGFTPIIDTATAHKNGGKLGVGEARAPIEAFELALKAFAKQYNLG